MKKLYITGALLLSTGLTFGQQNILEQNEPDAPATPVDKVKPNAKPISAKGGNTIWSEDFGNGWPAGWVVDDQSGICPWVYTTDGSWGYWNGNNATAADAGIQSTTSANGFLICDVDSANHFNYGQPSGSTYQYLSTYFITDSIDCSGFPAVKLEFEQFFRLNNSVDLEVQVSNDSINWTTWTVQGGAANNAASADPEMVSINISSVAGNQSSVYLRIGWSARVYFWMIDDMRIVEAPTDDVSLDLATFDDYVEYYYYPENHVSPMEFSAFLTNEGANAQNNVQLQVDIYDSNNNNVWNGTSSATNFAMLDTATLSVGTTYTPGAVGQYSMHFTATQDETDLVPGNDSTSFNFEVTPFEYGRDNGEYETQYWNGDDGNGNTIAYEYGTTYEIMQDDAIESISIYIGNNTDASVLMYAALYEIDAQGNFNYLNQTTDYVVDANDIGTWVTLPFSSPESITAGTQYLALAGHYGGPEALYVGRSSNSSPPQTSFLLDGADNTWYFTTRMPMVRINMEQPVGVEDIEESSFGLLAYPNPANDIVNLSFELSEASAVTAEVVDITGKVVLTQTMGTAPQGQNQTILNVQDLAAGTYAVRLSVNDQVQTTRLTLTR